ncbi:hypothetical protein HMPREF0765_0276 [Sphingobacterium spiritivorum ATCC 33300]|uniref:Uncharacterized protein n=2 Tax=Sphingobacterium spiritivorum TaxID=258 RepID=C2FSH0_SPHSI|nr:hypothetical protein HMPREF0765_0276 [Sphingobacterium spiritivorum ATCC 33300]
MKTGVRYRKGIGEVKKGEKKGQKIFSQIFWSFKKDFYLCSPFRNEGKKQDQKGRNALLK